MGKYLGLMLLAALIAGGALWLAGRGVMLRPAGASSEDVAGYVPGTDPLPPGALHILALGTSLTARGGWPAELEAALRHQRPGSRVEVLAKPGANSRWGEAALADRLAERPAPDVVLIEFSANDAALAHGLPRAEARSTHQRMIAAVRQAGAVPVLMILSPASGRQSWERPGLQAYQQDYRSTSGVWRIDSSGLWQAMPKAERDRLMPDGLHPKPEGWRTTLLPLLEMALSP